MSTVTPVRCRGATLPPPGSLPQSANRVLQDPLLENLEVLLAAQYAEKAGQGRLRRQTPFIPAAPRIPRRRPQARIPPQAVRIVLVRMPLNDQQQKRPQQAAHRMPDRALPPIVNQVLCKPLHKTATFHQLAHE